MLPYYENVYDTNTIWEAEKTADSIGIETLSGNDKRAAAELWALTESMYQEALNTASKYTAEGEDIPEELKRTILNAASLGTISGDYDAFNAAVGVAAYENEGYRERTKEIL